MLPSTLPDRLNINPEKRIFASLQNRADRRKSAAKMMIDAALACCFDISIIVTLNRE